MTTAIAYWLALVSTGREAAVPINDLRWFWTFVISPLRIWCVAFVYDHFGWHFEFMCAGKMCRRRSVKCHFQPLSGEWKLKEKHTQKANECSGPRTENAFGFSQSTFDVRPAACKCVFLLFFVSFRQWVRVFYWLPLEWFLFFST